MKTALTYYTVWGEKRLTPLGAALCIIGVLAAFIGAGVFLGEGFLFGLFFGCAVGYFYAQREIANRELREKLRREHLE